MQRLVYSPSMKAWVKTDFGVVDLSPYLTECTIERVIDDVSKLELVFRNPKVIQDGRPQFLFTQRLQSDGHIGPVFHPMDPITVILERIAGRPIQVFTGYCDTVPYVQIFPGLARITASCTLKRLQYTYWDPGLPFVYDFMEAYGWVLGNDGLVRRGNSGPSGNPPETSNSEYAKNLIKKTELNDSSIGNLLYAVLNEIGGWDNNNIYIQPLPENISEIVANIFDQFTKDNKAVNEEVAKFIKDIIGHGPFGNVSLGNPSGGGGGGGSVTIVGDSITHQSRTEISQAIPGITIYAEGSKHLCVGNDGYGTSNPGGDSGVKILRDNQSALGDIVVVALGTNDDPDKTTFGKWIDKAMTHIGSTKKAVFVTVTNRNSHNEAIQEAKSRHSNIYIADWKARAELQPGDVHPTERGKQVFANVIAEVVNSLRPAAAPTGTVNADVDGAKRYIGTRSGTAAFAIVDSNGSIIAKYNENKTFYGASITKAMILVAMTRKYDTLNNSQKSLLSSMIKNSSNGAANSLYASVGSAAINKVASDAGMSTFQLKTKSDGYVLGGSQVSAADMAKLFAKILTLIPSKHRSYAQGLMNSIVDGRFGVVSVDSQAYGKTGWNPTPGVAHSGGNSSGRGIAVMVGENPNNDAYNRQTNTRIAQYLINGS